jgi:hypothetical protein
MVAPRQQTPVIELAGQIGGLVSTIAVDGRYAYVGVGPRIAVLDLEDPTGPRPVAWSTILPAPVLDLAFEECGVVADREHAAVGGGDVAHGERLRVVDEREVGHPRLPVKSDHTAFAGRLCDAIWR